MRMKIFHPKIKEIGEYLETYPISLLMDNNEEILKHDYKDI